MSGPVPVERDLSSLIRDAFQRLLPGEDFAARVFEYPSLGCFATGQRFQLTREKNGTEHFHYNKGIEVGHFQYDPYVDNNRLVIKIPRDGLVARGQEILRELPKITTVNCTASLSKTPQGELIASNTSRLMVALLSPFERVSIFQQLCHQVEQLEHSGMAFSDACIAPSKSRISVRFTPTEAELACFSNAVKVAFNREGVLLEATDFVLGREIDINPKLLPRYETIANRILAMWYEQKINSGLDLSLLDF